MFGFHYRMERKTIKLVLAIIGVASIVLLIVGFEAALWHRRRLKRRKAATTVSP